MTSPVFEPGDLVGIRLGTLHAKRLELDPFYSRPRPTSRHAVFLRLMAGGEYAVVEAEEWGIRPAQTLRVLTADLVPRS